MKKIYNTPSLLMFDFELIQMCSGSDGSIPEGDGQGDHIAGTKQINIVNFADDDQSWDNE